MFRFSVRWLLAATALCCFCLAALNYPSEGMLVFVGLVLSASMLVAIAAAAGGRRRAFAAAYAGGLLVALAFSSGEFVIFRVPVDRVVSHAGLRILGPKENAHHPLDATMYSMLWDRPRSGIKVLIDHLRMWRFHRIAKAFLAMAFAASAGLLAEGLERRSKSGAWASPQKGACSTRWFVSMVGLFALLTTVALYCGSEAWAVVVGLVVIAGLLLATVRAASLGRAAPFSLGFALAGWAYLALSIFLFGNSEAGLRLPTEVITSFALSESLDLASETLSTAAITRGDYYPLYAGRRSYLMNVHRMALLLWSLVMGLVGGMATVVFVERDARRHNSLGSEAFTTPRAE